MLIVEVKNGAVEKALKEIKRKFAKTGILKELRNRQEFTKKSVTRRNELKKAKYIQKIKSNND